MARKQKTGPIIGFTLDYEESGGYSKMPWYALRENYCGAVSRFGAIPLPLPHELALVEDYLGMLDGLVVTGGAFDVPPEMYGQSGRHETVKVKDRRSQFEWAITKGAIERKLPILGICGGQQLLNVVLGGTLIQHIPDAVKNALEHEQKNPRTEPGHEVTVTEGTLLHRILTSPSSLRGGEADAAIQPIGNSGTSGEAGLLRFARNDGFIINVNSAHHQAVEKPAPGAIVDAVAPDGVIEGIELPQDMHPFCLGVQWHPEYFVTEADERIMAAFVAACHPRRMAGSGGSMNQTPQQVRGGERLAKRIARAGLCSRREAEAWIVAGRVKVGGSKITTPAFNVSDQDEVIVDGKPLQERDKTRMWLYHKPPGLVTTHKDPQSRPTVFDALPKELPRVLSIGRLDLNSEGLLLLTNDGHLSRKLELPSNGWIRRYRVRVFGQIMPAMLDDMKKGVTVNGVHYGSVETAIDSKTGRNSWLTVTLKEGKNREIRNIFEHFDCKVNRLIRLSYGPFQLGNLPRGEVKEVPGKVLKSFVSL